MTKTFTLYHNPKCGTSRNALALLQGAKADLNVVEYPKAGWTRPQLQSLLSKMGARPRDILRVRGAPDEALGLVGLAATDAEILDAMVKHPILVERPIVETSTQAVLGRPIERVSALIGKTPNA